MAIKYNQSPVNPNAYRTKKYGNLLSDTIRGEVDFYESWTGWRTNLSDPSKTDFRMGFKSRAAAARWVNEWLRKKGIK